MWIMVRDLGADRLQGRSRHSNARPKVGGRVDGAGRYPARVAIARLVLPSGRDVDVVRLEVSSGGTFLEGYPSARWNDMQLTALARNLAERYPHAGTYVIDPPRTRPDPPGTPPDPFGPVEMLPPVQCIGVLWSHPVDPDADSVLIESTLVVAWYQAEPVLPFDDSTRHLLEALDWDGLARDHER